MDILIKFDMDSEEVFSSWFGNFIISISIIFKKKPFMSTVCSLEKKLGGGIVTVRGMRRQRNIIGNYIIKGLKGDSGC